VKMHMISGGAMHELLAAGEMPMSISIFRNHVLAAHPKGAPTEWVPLDLVPTNAGGIALPAATNNPYAALLFADFLISPEGQKIFEEKFRFAVPTKNYGFKRWYPEKGLTVDQYEKAEERWKKLLMDVGGRREPSCGSSFNESVLPECFYLWLDWACHTELIQVESRRKPVE